MMFIYLFITALAAVVAGYVIGVSQSGALADEVDDQLKTILSQKDTIKELDALVGGKQARIEQLERERV